LSARRRLPLQSNWQKSNWPREKRTAQAKQQTTGVINNLGEMARRTRMQQCNESGAMRAQRRVKEGVTLDESTNSCHLAQVATEEPEKQRRGRNSTEEERSG